MIGLLDSKFFDEIFIFFVFISVIFCLLTFDAWRTDWVLLFEQTTKERGDKFAVTLNFDQASCNEHLHKFQTVIIKLPLRRNARFK